MLVPYAIHDDLFQYYFKNQKSRKKNGLNISYFQKALNALCENQGILFQLFSFFETSRILTVASTNLSHLRYDNERNLA